MRVYPAIELTWAADASEDELGVLLATIDDEGPTAVEERPSGLRVFFASAAARDRAAARLGAGIAIDVPDEDWAERSQAALGPVRVGDILVAPPWAATDPKSTPGVVFQPIGALPGSGAENNPRGRFQIVIQPSMGFGTGHHASTRLCLALLQRVPLGGTRVLDIGTGSGVLALAAWALGAASVMAIDVDPDAITAARENVERNAAGGGVALVVSDLQSLAANGDHDLILANLTAALLVRQAATIAATLVPGGRLILSGIQVGEDADVLTAFAGAGCRLVERLEEDGWVGLLLQKSTPGVVSSRDAAPASI